MMLVKRNWRESNRPSKHYLEFRGIRTPIMLFKNVIACAHQSCMYMDFAILDDRKILILFGAYMAIDAKYRSGWFSQGIQKLSWKLSGCPPNHLWKYHQTLFSTQSQYVQLLHPGGMKEGNSNKMWRCQGRFCHQGRCLCNHEDNMRQLCCQIKKLKKYKSI